ncbi:hypothetical protein Unana1_05954 [Umbelopsis nana]
MHLFRILHTTAIRRNPVIRPPCIKRLNFSSWTKEEDQSLQQFVQQHGGKWSEYVAHYAPHRSPASCRYRYTDIIRPDLKQGPFDASEIEKLRDGVREFGVGKWRMIEKKYLPDRPKRKLANVWSLQADPNIVKGGWTEEEDELLRRGVERYGQSWTRIARESLPHRSRQSLRHRYVETLSGDLKHGGWSEEEQKLLLERVIMFGANNWTKVAQGIVGRDARMCKQAWNLKVDPSLRKNDWEDIELRIFWNLVQKKGKQWNYIASQLPGRSYQDCYHLFWKTVKEELGKLAENADKRSYGNTWCKAFAKSMSDSLDPSKRIIRAEDGSVQEIDVGKWSKNDIATLANLLAENTLSDGTVEWKNIYKRFPNRTKAQCRDEARYQLRLQQGMRPFDQNEDDKLADLVKTHGQRWDVISYDMPGRTNDDCQYRWEKYLKWKLEYEGGRRRLTEDEKDLIRQGVSMFGNDWQAISQTYLPNISPQRCMNWWYSVGRHQDSIYSKEDIDTFLKLAVGEQNSDDEIDWRKVAMLVPMLSASQCKARWQMQNTESAPWTPSEELALIEAVHKYRGNPNYRRNMWATIAKEVGNNRTAQQCASRLYIINKRRSSSARISR